MVNGDLLGAGEALDHAPELNGVGGRDDFDL
jgi:hypothetical protein